MEESTESMMNEQQFKYFAFISYNSKDTEWGKRVQRKLEHYRMPATMCNERGWKRKTAGTLEGFEKPDCDLLP